MRESDMTQFRKLLTDAMAFYRQDVSPFALSVWWQACQGFELEQVSKAMTRHAMDAERGQFAPKPADIVRQLSGTATDKAMLAWGKAIDAASRVGAYTDVVFDDAAIHATIEDLGGWPKFCRGETKDLSYLQHRFTEAHQAYTGRGEFEYPKRLGGDRSPDSEYARRCIQLPRPMLVGNPERAIAVLQNGSAAGKTPITALPAQAVRLLANCGPQEHAA